MKSRSVRRKAALKAKQRRRAARRQGAVKVRKSGGRMRGRVKAARRD
ncbi:MAG: hypothetical protein ACON5B_17060 [Myxococcota bacterium]